jgi:hypothetical protein
LSKIKDIITFAAAKSALIAFEQNMGHQLWHETVGLSVLVYFLFFVYKILKELKNEVNKCYSVLINFTDVYSLNFTDV